MSLLQSALNEPPSVNHGEHSAGQQPPEIPDDVLGSISDISIDPDAPLISRAEDATVLEHYRKLRTKVLQEQTAKPFRTLLVTSPNPQEGKTVTVLNLGLSLAMLPSFKVLIVDGDLRRGSLGKRLGIDGGLGLSNFIAGSVKLQDVVLRNEDLPVYFMSRGNSEIAAGELLQSYDLKSKFQSIAEHFSLVVIDSPPANLIADVPLLASACDAVLLIARAFSTSRKSFERAAREVSKFRVIGTVLNAGANGIPYQRYRGYY